MRAPSVLQSGRQGEFVYYVRNGRQCRRRYVVPKDPHTAAQLRVRAAFGAASKAWGTLLREEDRRACIAAGEKVQSHVRLGQSGPLTGQLYWVGRSCAKGQIGRGQVRWPSGRENVEARMQ